MARVEGENDSQYDTSDDIRRVMPVICHTTNTTETSPKHQQTLQKGHEEKRL